jgi:hypothetical protein
MMLNCWRMPFSLLALLVPKKDMQRHKKGFWRKNKVTITLFPQKIWHLMPNLLVLSPPLQSQLYVHVVWLYRNSVFDQKSFDFRYRALQILLFNDKKSQKNSGMKIPEFFVL